MRDVGKGRPAATEKSLRRRAAPAPALPAHHTRLTYSSSAPAVCIEQAGAARREKGGIGLRTADVKLFVSVCVTVPALTRVPDDAGERAMRMLKSGEGEGRDGCEVYALYGRVCMR